jgi:hypothetical protein
MIKLMLITLTMVLSSSSFAQTDTIIKRMYRDTMPNGEYRERMYNDTMPIGKYGDRMKRDSIPYGRYGDRVNRDTTLNGLYGDKMNRANTPYERQNDKMSYPKGGKMANMSKEKHLMMKDGKVIMMKNGKMRTIKAYTNLNMGTRVMADGSIIKKDGSKMMLQEGESINMAGEIMYMQN